ncbi:MAG: HEAT repeat domain-containing protein [Limisphaerales bacterium]
MSEWFEDYIPFESRYGTTPVVRHYDATNAIAAMGKTATPTLLRWNDATDPDWMPLGLKLWTSGFHPNWFGRLLWRHHKMTRRAFAEIGFRIVGTNALPALAELERQFLAAKTLDEVQAAQALISVFDLEGLSFFVQVLQTNSNALHCAGAARGFTRTAGPNPDKGYLGVGALIKFLQTDQAEACDAAIALVYCQSPRLTVPALVKALGSPNPSIRRASVEALGMMGRGNAYEAVPKMQKLLADRDTSVSEEARRVLQNFAPEVLTNRAAISK